MATIASLIVEISAKSEKLKAGLSSAYSSVSSFAAKAAKTLAVIGTVVGVTLVAAFSKLTSMISEQADKIDRMSKEAQKIGASYAEFQKLAYGADLAGVSTDQLAQSIKKLNIGIGDAQMGTGSAKDAFDKLGLSASALANMSVEDRFLAISDALRQVTDKTLQSKLAVDIFGKSGVDSLVFLTSNIRETSKEFADLGLTITDAQASAVESFNDSKTRLGAIWEGFKDQLTVAVAPAFDEFIKWITQTIKEMGGMEKAAQTFARGMISGIKLAVSALGGLLNLLDKVQKVMLFFEERDLQQQRNKAMTENQRQLSPANGLSWKTGQLSGLEDSFIPSIKVQQQLENLDKAIEKNHQQFNSLETAGAERLRLEKQLQGMLDNQISNIGKKQSANDAIFEGVMNGIKNQAQKVGEGFQSVADAAKTNATSILDSAKKVESVIAQMEKSAGQSELTRILGLDKENSKQNPLAQSEEFDRLVRQIYQKQTTGAGTQPQTGTFNGKEYTFNPTTISQDMKRLREIFEQQSRDGNNTIGMKGVIDELTKFVNSKTEQKVKVDINVKADKGFLAEVATSQEVAKAVDEQIKNYASNEAKRMKG